MNSESHIGIESELPRHQGTKILYTSISRPYFLRSRDLEHVTDGLVIAISFPLRRRHVSFVTRHLFLRRLGTAGV
jgi:hypothetical protein